MLANDSDSVLKVHDDDRHEEEEQVELSLTAESDSNSNNYVSDDVISNQNDRNRINCHSNLITVICTNNNGNISRGTQILITGTGNNSPSSRGISTMNSAPLFSKSLPSSSAENSPTIFPRTRSNSNVSSATSTSSKVSFVSRPSSGHKVNKTPVLPEANFKHGCLACRLRREQREAAKRDMATSTIYGRINHPKGVIKSISLGNVGNINQYCSQQQSIPKRTNLISRIPRTKRYDYSHVQSRYMDVHKKSSPSLSLSPFTGNASSLDRAASRNRSASVSKGTSPIGFSDDIDGNEKQLTSQPQQTSPVNGYVSASESIGVQYDDSFDAYTECSHDLDGIHSDILGYGGYEPSSWPSKWTPEMGDASSIFSEHHYIDHHEYNLDCMFSTNPEEIILSHDFAMPNFRSMPDDDVIQHDEPLNTTNDFPMLDHGDDERHEYDEDDMEEDQLLSLEQQADLEAINENYGHDEVLTSKAVDTHDQYDEEVSNISVTAQTTTEIVSTEHAHYQKLLKVENDKEETRTFNGEQIITKLKLPFSSTVEEFKKVSTKRTITTTSTSSDSHSLIASSTPSHVSNDKIINYGVETLNHEIITETTEIITEKKIVQKKIIHQAVGITDDPAFTSVDESNLRFMSIEDDLALVENEIELPTILTTTNDLSSDLRGVRKEDCLKAESESITEAILNDIIESIVENGKTEIRQQTNIDKPVVDQVTESESAPPSDETQREQLVGNNVLFDLNDEWSQIDQEKPPSIFEYDEEEHIVVSKPSSVATTVVGLDPFDLSDDRQYQMGTIYSNASSEYVYPSEEHEDAITIKKRLSNMAKNDDIVVYENSLMVEKAIIPDESIDLASNKYLLMKDTILPELDSDENNPLAKFDGTEPKYVHFSDEVLAKEEEIVEDKSLKSQYFDIVPHVVADSVNPEKKNSDVLDSLTANDTHGIENDIIVVKEILKQNEMTIPNEPEVEEEPVNLREIKEEAKIVPVQEEQIATEKVQYVDVMTQSEEIGVEEPREEELTQEMEGDVESISNCVDIYIPSSTNLVSEERVTIEERESALVQETQDAYQEFNDETDILDEKAATVTAKEEEMAVAEDIVENNDSVSVIESDNLESNVAQIYLPQEPDELKEIQEQELHIEETNVDTECEENNNLVGQESPRDGIDQDSILSVQSSQEVETLLEPEESQGIEGELDQEFSSQVDDTSVIVVSPPVKLEEVEQIVYSEEKSDQVDAVEVKESHDIIVKEAEPMKPIEMSETQIIENEIAEMSVVEVQGQEVISDTIKVVEKDIEFESSSPATVDADEPSVTQKESTQAQIMQEENQIDKELIIVEAEEDVGRGVMKIDDLVEHPTAAEAAERDVEPIDADVADDADVNQEKTHENEPIEIVEASTKGEARVLAAETDDLSNDQELLQETNELSSHDEPTEKPNGSLEIEPEAIELISLDKPVHQITLSQSEEVQEVTFEQTPEDQVDDQKMNAVDREDLIVLEQTGNTEPSDKTKSVPKDKAPVGTESEQPEVSQSSQSGLLSLAAAALFAPVGLFTGVSKSKEALVEDPTSEKSPVTIPVPVNEHQTGNITVEQNTQGGDIVVEQHDDEDQQHTQPRNMLIEDAEETVEYETTHVQQTNSELMSSDRLETVPVQQKIEEVEIIEERTETIIIEDAIKRSWVSSHSDRVFEKIPIENKENNAVLDVSAEENIEADDNISVVIDPVGMNKEIYVTEMPKKVGVVDVTVDSIKEEKEQEDNSSETVGISGKNRLRETITEVGEEEKEQKYDATLEIGEFSEIGRVDERDVDVIEQDEEEEVKIKSVHEFIEEEPLTKGPEVQAVSETTDEEIQKETEGKEVSPATSANYIVVEEPTPIEKSATEETLTQEGFEQDEKVDIDSTHEEKEKIVQREIVTQVEGTPIEVTLENASYDVFRVEAMEPIGISRRIPLSVHNTEVERDNSNDEFIPLPEECSQMIQLDGNVDFLPQDDVIEVPIKEEDENILPIQERSEMNEELESQHDELMNEEKDDFVAIQENEEFRKIVVAKDNRSAEQETSSFVFDGFEIPAVKVAAEKLHPYPLRSVKLTDIASQVRQRREIVASSNNSMAPSVDWKSRFSSRSVAFDKVIEWTDFLIFAQVLRHKQFQLESLYIDLTQNEASLNKIVSWSNKHLLIYQQESWKIAKLVQSIAMTWVNLIHAFEDKEKRSELKQLLVRTEVSANKLSALSHSHEAENIQTLFIVQQALEVAVKEGCASLNLLFELQNSFTNF